MLKFTLTKGDIKMYAIITDNLRLIQMAKEEKQDIINLTHFDLTISSHISNSRTDATTDGTTHKTITELLISLGIPAHIKGFEYLAYCIEHALSFPNLTSASFTKDIYPDAADCFQTKPFNVERNIRTALRYAYSKNNSIALKKIFDFYPASGIPKNSEFICSITTYLQNNYVF